MNIHDMLVSATVLKWAMRFYPPLFLQRIWVKKINKDFSGVHVIIAQSILNVNYNRSVFGGTIFSATDPFYPVLFHQILHRKGYHVKIWVKRSEINYLLPGFENLSFSIQIDESEIAEACKVLHTDKKFIKTYTIRVLNTQGTLCAVVKNEIYIRNLKTNTILQD